MNDYILFTVLNILYEYIVEVIVNSINIVKNIIELILLDVKKHTGAKTIPQITKSFPENLWVLYQVSWLDKVHLVRIPIMELLLILGI